MKIYNTQQIEYDDGSLSPAVTSTTEIPKHAELELHVAVRGYLYQRGNGAIVVALGQTVTFEPVCLHDPAIEQVTTYVEISPNLEDYWFERPDNLLGGSLRIPTTPLSIFTERVSDGWIAFRAVSSSGAMSKKTILQILVQEPED